jgi:hypothetical protein
MDGLMILRTFAAVTTVLAAALVAANSNARTTVSCFVIFIIASLAWMSDGWLLINVLGVWRWLPKRLRKRFSYERAQSQYPSRHRNALLIATAALAPSAMAMDTSRTSRDTSPAT